MATKSRARKTMEALLASATTPEQKADYASRLAKIVHQEGVERARRRRAKAKQPPKPAPVRDDSNDVFELDNGASSTLPPTVVEKLSPEKLREIETVHEQPVIEIDDEPEEDDDAAPLQYDPGVTRVLPHGDGLSFDEQYPTARFHNDLTYVEPLAFLGAPAVDSDEFIGGRFASDAAMDAEDAADALWREQMEKLYGK